MKPKKVAFLCAQGLGDGLILACLAHNFFLSGCQVTLFNTPLMQLKRWLPGKQLLPFADETTSFDPFDLVISAAHTPFSGQPFLTTIFEELLDKKKSYVSNLARLAQDHFNLPHFGLDNGLLPPPDLEPEKYPKRVILHPTSTSDKRVWPKDKFLEVAKGLRAEGWEPKFCLAPYERAEWEHELRAHELEAPHFETLDELACYLFESSALIGNNSGPGHLASNMGRPTLSLFAKKSYSRLWRPGWGRNQVLTPPSLPLGGRARQTLWKRLLTPKRVLKTYLKSPDLNPKKKGGVTSSLIGPKH